MALPLLALGLVALGGSIVAISHLIQPLSIIAAVVAMLGMYIILQQRGYVALTGVELVDDGLAVVLSVGAGFLVYRSIAWALAAIGFGTAFLIIVLFLAGGPAVFVYGGQLLMAWLVER